MARLPTIGGDDGNWGTILNDYLSVAHNSGGDLNNNTVATNTLQNGSITTAKLDSINSPTNGQVLSYNGTKFAWSASSTGQSVAIKDESTTLTSAASSIAFVGTGVTATNTGSDVTVTVPNSALDSADFIISKNGATYQATSSASGTMLSSGADAGAILTAAISALGANGGTIAFKPGVYTWSSVPALPADLTGWLRIIGQMTTISLTTAGSRFLDFNKLADGNTFRNLHIENFTIDAGALSSTGGTQHIIIGTYHPTNGIASGVNVNFEYLVLRNLRSIGVRVAPSATAHHLNIFIGLHQSSAGLPENHIEHILVENCDMDGGNHGVTIYGNKAGAWSGNPTIRLEDIVVRHIRHDMRTAPTGFDFTSHVHISSLAYGGDVLIEDVWGYGSRDVGVEVDGMMNSRIENVVAVNYFGFSVALTNYNTPTDYRAQHVYVRNAVGIRNAGQASASSSSVVGIRTTPGLPNGHFTLENIKHYRSAGAPDLSTSPIAGDLVSVKGSIESLTLNGGHYEAIGAVLSGSSGVAAQIVYVDDLTSTRTRITINNLDVRFRGAKAGGATAGIALAAVQLNGDVDIDVENVRMYVDFPAADQVTAIDIGGASGGTVRGRIDAVKIFGPNLGPNAKGVFVPSSASETIPYANALRIRNIDPDAVPAGNAIFIGDATNKSLVDLGIMPLSAAAKTITANYNIASSDGIIFVNSAGNVTVSLPSATTSGGGKEFIVRPTGTGTTFVNALGGNVDGLAQVTLTGATAFASDGANWYSVSIIAGTPAVAISFAARTVTSNTVLTAADGVVFANGTGITLTLPSGTTSGAGKQFILKNIGTDDVAGNAAGGNIEGGASVIIKPGVSIAYVSDGTNWIAISKTGNDALIKSARIITTNYTTVHTDGSIFINAGSVTVTLPSATNSGGGKQFLLKDLSGLSAQVNAAGGNVNGAGQIALAANTTSVFTSDGTNWWGSI
jgi:hypothetical protein